MTQKPLILAPAGSPDALEAALFAGADEIYFGLWEHNARINAKNFTKEDASIALRKCKLRGVKSNITLNTLVTDRELLPACRMAYEALEMGADAFIVQDLGLARALKKAIPQITLHASTQCACHSKSGAEMLGELGFSRIVLARELPVDEIKEITSLGLETEVFVHGALCVCHSGMCLMSSVIGKRSGNRGLCAQPCRLPYNLGETKADEKNVYRYPLSLKDLSLANHVTSLCDMGISSLKIEGRMKSPDYVFGVTNMWKSLVTENRNATEKELDYLKRLFSRNGFTDGYFTGTYIKSNRNMYGVRSDSDKADTTRTESEIKDLSRREITMKCRIKEGEKATLTLETNGFTHTEESRFISERAIGKPMTSDDINACLGKLGDTDFMYTGIQTDIEGNVFIPKSQLNAFRRDAVAGLEAKLLQLPKIEAFDEMAIRIPKSKGRSHQQQKLRLFPSSEEGLTELLKKYSGYQIESVCLPIELFLDDSYTGILKVVKDNNLPFGVRLPRVVFTAEEGMLDRLISLAKDKGATFLVAENIGQVYAAKKSGLSMYAGAGMNIFNSHTVMALKELGFCGVNFSSELNSAQMRDMESQDMTVSVIGEGRLELMVLESCVIKCSEGCKKTKNGGICHTLCDRTGAVFPIKSAGRLTGEYPCRNIILNSVPLKLLSKKDELIKMGAEIINIYE